MVRQIKYIAILLLTLLSSTPIYAHNYRNAESTQPTHHLVCAYAELFSIDVWKLEAAYHWFPIKYIGIGGAIGAWKQYIEDGVPSTPQWCVDDKSAKMYNGYFMPSVIMKSPSFIKSENLQLGLMSEVGFMMNIPYRKVEIGRFTNNEYYVYDRVSCNKGEWSAINIRAGVYLNCDAISISLGYVFSNLDIYGMHRNMQYKGTKFNQFYPKRRNTGGAFLMVGYSF